MSVEVSTMEDDLGPVYKGQPMTLMRLQAERSMLEHRLTHLRSIRAGCKTCANFPRGVCELYESIPPKDFQDADGDCKEWVYDGIPL